MFAFPGNPVRLILLILRILQILESYYLTDTYYVHHVCLPRQPFDDPESIQRARAALDWSYSEDYFPTYQAAFKTATVLAVPRSIGSFKSSRLSGKPPTDWSSLHLLQYIPIFSPAISTWHLIFRAADNQSFGCRQATLCLALSDWRESDRSDCEQRSA